MKVKDLNHELGILGKADYGDYDVVVMTQGMGGPHEAITGVSCGFDWYDGKIILHTNRPLSTLDDRKYSELFLKFLRKISNYDKVNQGLTKTAKYRKKEFAAEDKYKALEWLHQQLDEELDKE